MVTLQQHRSLAWLHTSRRAHATGWRLVLLVAGALLLAACGGQENAALSAEGEAAAAGNITIATAGELLGETVNAQLVIGDEAPDFAYTMPDGTTQRLSDLRGQKVLVNFWATWCGPCKVEMPDLEQASQEYADEGLVVLGVNHSEEAEVIEPFAREFGLTFPLIANEDGDIVKGYAAMGLPTSFFINSDGTVSFRQIGVMDFEFIEQRVAEMQ